MNERLYAFTIGLLMGIADAVPGISGGTILFLSGQYDRVIEIANLRLSHILTLTAQFLFDGKQELDISIDSNTSFLLLLVCGVVSGLVCMLVVLDYLITNYQILLYGVFTGIILASAIAITRRDISINRLAILLVLLGACTSILIQYFSVSIGHSLGIIFISGIAATTSMVLPGLSGALVLLVLGQYEFIIDTLHASIANVTDLSKDTVLTTLMFGSGGIVGVIANIQIIHSVLERNRNAVLSFLIGLVYGSVTAPITSAPEVAVTDAGFLITAFVSFCIGIGFLILFKK